MDDDFELDDEEDDVLALFSVFFHRKKHSACAQMRARIYVPNPATGDSL